LLVVLCLVAGGCVVPSLHPLYTDKDLIFDTHLVGIWRPEDSKETWAFTRQGDKEYRFVHTDDSGKRLQMTARLLEIKRVKFLDFSPVEDEEYAPNTGPLLRAHVFLLVLQTQPTLRVSFLNDEWLDEYLKENPRALKHERIKDADGTDDQIVLTAAPGRLQRFLLAHRRTPGAFNEPISLTRRKE
jgi:hypothetical protein